MSGVGFRPRMVKPIDLAALRENGTCMFEIADFGQPEMDEVKEAEEDMIDKKKEFFEGLSLKNIPVVHESSDETCKDFDEYEVTWDPVEDGVRKKLIKPGRGNPVEDGSKVAILFTAIAEHADEAFDEFTNVRYPFRFHLGSGRVIQGLDVAVGSMAVGEISKFLLQPEVAYGKLGHPPRIPENAKVLFTIELLEAKLYVKGESVLDMTEEERLNLPFEKVLKAAEELKDEGNKEFKKKNYADAVQLYSKSWTVIEGYAVVHVSTELEKNQLMYTLLNNLALCYESLDKPKKAIKACQEALQLDVPAKKDKPYFRLGKMYHKIGNLEEAKKMLIKAQEIDKHNHQTNELLSKVVEEFDEAEREKTHLYKEMMGVTINRAL